MSRHANMTQKIPKSVTGLNGSLFVHVDFDENGMLESIRFSEKSKDGNQLDTILTVLGDVCTDMLKGKI